MKIVIGGKEYEARATLADVIKAREYYPTKEKQTLDDPEYQKFALESAKRFINRTSFIPKFLTWKSLLKRMTVKEFVVLDEQLGHFFKGTDPETKN